MKAFTGWPKRYAWWVIVFWKLWLVISLSGMLICLFARQFVLAVIAGILGLCCFLMIRLIRISYPEV